VKSGFSKKGVDVLSSLIMLAAGIAIYIISMPYQVEIFQYDPTDAWLPKVCGGAIALLSAVRLILSLCNKDEAYAKRSAATKEGSSNMIRGISSIVLLLFYVLCYGSLGFLLSTAIYLFVQMTFFTEKGQRHWLRTAIISVVFPIMVYLLFVKVLNYTLPTGILGW